MCRRHPNPNFDLVSRIGTLTMTLFEMLAFLLLLALVTYAIVTLFST